MAQGPGALSEDRFSQSPNAARQYRLHEEALAELDKAFYRSTDAALGSFETSARMHTERYTHHLNNTVLRLTRAGRFDEAQAVGVLLEASKDWAVTPPDRWGRHFLTKTDLTDVPAEEAQRHGEKLLELMDRAADHYVKQVEAAQKRYANHVDAARKDYRVALEGVLSSEQRAGRLGAVKQVQAELMRLETLPRAERPAADEQGVELFKQAGPAGAGPERPAGNRALSGYYLLQYFKGSSQQAKFHYLVEFEGGKGKLHASSWSGDKIKWQRRAFDISIITAGPDSIVYQHGTTGGKTAVHQATFREDGLVTDTLWWSTEAYLNGKASERGTIEPIGNPSEGLEGLPEGTFIVDIHSRRGSDGAPESKRARYRMVHKGGVLAVTGIKWGRFDKDWPAMVPRVLTAQEAQGGYILRYDRRTSPLGHVLVLDLHEDALPTMRIWWKHSAYERGDPAAATGTLNGRWRIDLDRL